MAFNNFPFVDLQNLNIDWILRKVKEAVDTATEASEDIDEALTTARQAKQEADSAVADVQIAGRDASNALSIANTASTTANAASTQADYARSLAEGADTAASNAVYLAEGASNDAGQAASDASDALTAANSALSTAQQALTVASTASKDTKIYMNGYGTSFTDSNNGNLTRTEILGMIEDGEHLFFEKTDTGEIFELFTVASTSFSIYQILHDSTNATAIKILTIPESGTVSVNTYPFPSGGSGGGSGFFFITATYVSNGDYFTFNKTGSQIQDAIEQDDLVPIVIYSYGQGQYQYFTLGDFNFDGEDIYIYFYRNYRYSGNNYCDVLYFVDSEHKAYKFTTNLNGSANAVLYTAQNLTDLQKAQARTNIGASAETIRETVSGATATIDAEVDTLYLCGTMTSLTIDTFPPTGIFSVVFASGSTATTLTVPNTLIMPDGFTVGTNKRYEINVMDGYAVVAEWGVSP